LHARVKNFCAKKNADSAANNFRYVISITNRYDAVEMRAMIRRTTYQQRRRAALRNYRLRVAAKNGRDVFPMTASGNSLSSTGKPRPSPILPAAALHPPVDQEQPVIEKINKTTYNLRVVSARMRRNMASIAVVELLFENFKDRVGDTFTLREEGLPAFALTLEEATPLPARYALKGARPPFSLMFLGTDPRILPQRLYRLGHDAMGEVTIFLVPVGKDARGVRYQATFN
jgi:hypothetical protein